MKKLKYLIILLIVPFFFESCDELDLEGAQDLSTEEIVQGLKTALEVGTDTAVTVLESPGGFYEDEAVKILLPDEAQPAIDLASNYAALTPALELLLEGLNRSAENAATMAGPIFKDEILTMTIEDALGILNGGPTSATDYLREKTYNGLRDAFADHINTSLDRKLVNDYSTTDLWTSLANIYNVATVFIPNSTTMVNPDLGQYVTGKALDGIFSKVAIE